MTLMLLNNESVVNEVVSFAKWQISNILKIPYESVEASWYLDDDGKIRRKFNVDAYVAEGVDESDIREVIASIAMSTQKTLSDWLAANEVCRDGSEKDIEKEVTEKESQEPATEENIASGTGGQG